MQVDRSVKLSGVEKIVLYFKEQVIQRLEITHIWIFIKTDVRIAIGTNIIDC